MIPGGGGSVPPGVERAISISGGEFVPSALAASQAFSNVTLQTYASDYRYEGTPSVLTNANHLTFDYLYGRGWRRVKIPVRWERIQQTLGGALNTTETNRLTKCLDMANTAGMKAIIDIHNSGHYYLDGAQTIDSGDSAGTGYRRGIASTDVTQAHFVDLWSRMATLYASHAAVVGFHLMNEPQGNSGLTRAQWYSASQAAVDAIRAVSQTVTIRVGGWHFSDCFAWTTNNPSGTWITDTTGLTFYEAHHYWSEGEDGNYTTYANAVSHAASQGHSAGSNPDALYTKVLYDLNQFASWCATYGVQGVIGEMNWPSNVGGADQTSWNALGNTYLSRCDTLGMRVNAWATGEFYGASSDPLLIYNSNNGTTSGVNTTRQSAATWEAHL